MNTSSSAAVRPYEQQHQWPAGFGGRSDDQPLHCLQIAEQEYKKQLLQTDRLDERNRGLLWLAVATVAMLWLAGAFEIDATHPFIF